MLRFIIAIFACMFLIIVDACAADTILASSIKWDDVNSRDKLLEQVPRWNDDVVKELFAVYQHPTQHKLPLYKNTHKYNVQFINAFWGPLDNPFNKYSRPAKAFVIVGDGDANKTPTYYLAPLIQNTADGNDYIFDNKQSQVILLTQWIENIKQENAGQVIYFNICLGYGNELNDVCHANNYQNEVGFVSTNDIAKYPSNLSAARAADVDWKTMINTKINAEQNSILNESVKWNDLEQRNQLLATVAAWPNYKTISDNFILLRDLRYLADPEATDFARRPSWLLPDDGCWARASAVIKDLFGPYQNVVNQYPRPTKVFAFGNLCVNTENSAKGRVTWWYHTALIVKDESSNVNYVLDPALNPLAPLPVEEWMAQMAARTNACANSKSHVDKFSICNGYGTGPYQICDAEYKKEVSGMLDQINYLKWERSRQSMLGRDADKVLGDSPPWA